MNYKILMALMAMEIGGAETHVLELCKSLKQAGLDVFVVSNGGAYVDELEEYGISHFKAPLHNKNIKNIWNSYKVIKKIIVENNIKLVHAHARIPAFVCSLLAKKLGFRFLTTVHWDFNVTFPFNLLSRWGEKSLAVSEDLKKYLVKNYKVLPENVVVTINGIDTEKFLPKTSDLENIKQNIVHVSRMDKKTNRTAYKLMEAIELLHPEFPDLTLTIVGGGDDEDTIFKQVKICNARAGYDYIFFTGRRTDVFEWLRQGEIFVGISRAALEAMSCELPVILAGDTGYIGIFDESKLSIGMETNFTCRGCVEVSIKQLAEDIKNLLLKSDEKKNLLGAYNRKIVAKHYSVNRMCQDALSLYETMRVSNRPIDAVISGYYGFKNNGDDIVLKSIIDDLREARPNIKITVLSKKPGETRAFYNVEVINRFNFLAVNRLFKYSKMLITGGGSLIQDVTSTKSLIYYLWLINHAHKKGAKNMLYANGMGPIRHKKNMIRVSKILNKVDLITLRDCGSQKTLTDFGVTNPEIYVTADAAYSLKDVSLEPAKKLLDSIGLRSTFLAIAVRNWKYNQSNFAYEVAAFADYMQETYQITSLFIPMRPEDDTEISKHIISLMKIPGFFLGEKYSPVEIIGVVGMAEFILGMRLHTLIYAAKGKIPAIGLVYDNKIKMAMDALGQNFYLPVENFTCKELQIYAEEILKNKEDIKSRICNAVEIAKAKSRENIKLCIDLMDQPLF